MRITPKPQARATKVNMAVLKSPKNVAKKDLWMRKITSSTKKTSFYFYNQELAYERSSLYSFASKRNSVLYYAKYRSVSDLYKEEKKVFGRILPSTLDKPEPLRSHKTYLSKSWSTNHKFRFDFFTLLNSSNLVK